MKRYKGWSRAVFNVVSVLILYIKMNGKHQSAKILGACRQRKFFPPKSITDF
jgi:hypothetical protein